MLIFRLRMPLAGVGEKTGLLASGKDGGNAGLGSLAVVVNIVMAYVGAGVLGLPYGFMRAGFVGGTLLLSLGELFLLVKALDPQLHYLLFMTRL